MIKVAIYCNCRVIAFDSKNNFPSFLNDFSMILRASLIFVWGTKVFDISFAFYANIIFF